MSRDLLAAPGLCSTIDRSRDDVMRVLRTEAAAWMQARAASLPERFTVGADLVELIHSATRGSDEDERYELVCDLLIADGVADAEEEMMFGYWGLLNAPDPLVRAAAHFLRPDARLNELAQAVAVFEVAEARAKISVSFQEMAGSLISTILKLNRDHVLRDHTFYLEDLLRLGTSSLHRVAEATRHLSAFHCKNAVWESRSR